MKKLFSVWAVICLLVSLTACDQSEPNALSGEVVTCGGDPYFFELACEDGMNFGFLVNESTELIWEDKSAFEIWDEDDDEWDVFGCSMYVTVIPGEVAESADEYVDECVEGWYYAKQITVTGVNDAYFAVDAKPVIYLYPEVTTDVEVKLDYSGKLTCTYPAYADGWKVTAEPDSTLTDSAGMQYNYLYWEGTSDIDYDFSKGFCVAGPDSAAFLETALAQLGLNRREANEFIVYWLPKLEANPNNLISFQTDAYTDKARLTINPAPDTVIRVFMAWKPLEDVMEIAPQELTAPERTGFVVVEWGGAQVG